MMNLQQKTYILELVEKWLQKAMDFYQIDLPCPEIKFDLSGSAAGQFRGSKNSVLRFNGQIAAQQFEAFCSRTIPHEVAHFVVHQLHTQGRYRPNPHGEEWRSVMQTFGVDSSRCHDYDLSQVRVRRQSRYQYACTCQTHELSATRHNRIIRNHAIYHCCACGDALTCQ